MKSTTPTRAMRSERLPSAPPKTNGKPQRRAHCPRWIFRYSETMKAIATTLMIRKNGLRTYSGASPSSPQAPPRLYARTKDSVSLTTTMLRSSVVSRLSVISAQAFVATSAIKTAADKRAKNTKLGLCLGSEGGTLEGLAPAKAGDGCCVSGELSAGAIDIVWFAFLRHLGARCQSTAHLFSFRHVGSVLLPAPRPVDRSCPMGVPGIHRAARYLGSDAAGA